MSEPRISVCIIARDEAERLPRALASVAGFADEVIVVDSGSSDGTPELAAGAGARVVHNPWSGYGAQRNVALDHATGDWVLELDADEWCSEALAREIGEFVRTAPPEVSIALIPMRQRFLGRELSAAGHYPFLRSRLFRRGAYRHEENLAVHEGLWPRERPWVLRSDMHHELAGTLGEAWRDTIAYARLEASAIHAVPLGALLVGGLARPATKALYRSLLLGGWRDGTAGLVRIALESIGDALTWMLAARRAPRAIAARSDGHFSLARSDGHFSVARSRGGPVGVIAVGNPLPHDAWLDDLTQLNVSVTVICSAGEAAAVGGEAVHGARGLRIRAAGRLGPLGTLRAIDEEQHMLPIETWVALDARGARRLRVVPGAREVRTPADLTPRALVADALARRAG